MSKLKTGIGHIVFGLFLFLVFSLGTMKPSIGAGYSSITPTDLIFPLLLLSWILSVVIGEGRLRWRHEYSAFAIFFLALLLSSIFSTDQNRSFIKLGASAYLILLAILTPHIVTTFERLRIVALVWIAGSFLSLVAALVALVLFYSAPDSALLASLTHHYGSVPVGYYPRLSSTFVSASMFCNFLTVTLVLTLVAAKLKWIRGPWVAVLVGAIGISAVFTFSIALGGLALAIGLWLWVTTSENKLVARLSLALGILIAIAFLVIAPFALSLGSGESFIQRLNPSARALVWTDAWSTFLADPLTGKGLGTAVANVVFQNSDGSVSLLTDAHNVFLSVGAQAGLVGLVAIIGLVFVTLRAGLFNLPGSTEMLVIRSGLAIAFFAGFVYDGMTGAFEDARHLWVLAGLILAASSIDRPPNQVP